MVHSIELLLDDAADEAIRRSWAELGAIASVRPARGRPHITVTVGERISHDVDALLGPVSQRLPFRALLGAPLLFGSGPFILARLVVPSSELLSVHAQVNRVSAAYVSASPFAHTEPGGWTPHVTLARGLTAENMGPVLDILSASQETIGAQVAALRRWDGDEKVEYHLAGRAC